MNRKNILPSTVLSTIAAIGVIITAVSVGKATPKALERIKADSKKNHDGNPYAYTKKEAIKSSWKFYIPSVVAGTTTIVCIFGIDILGKRQQASISSAYALLNSSYQEYKDKLKELYGEEAHQKIIDSIVSEKARDVYISSSDFVGTSSLYFDDRSIEERRIFYDVFSNRYFESTVAQVIEAEYHLNRNWSLGMDVTINDFYEFIGITGIDGGDEMRWFAYEDGIGWLDFSHRKTTLDDGLEIYVIEIVFPPRLPTDEDEY